MKHILILALCLSTCTLSAQTDKMSDVMELFKDYCLRVRDGIGEKNVAVLEDCLIEYDSDKLSDEGTFDYKSTSIGLITFEDLTVKDGKDAVPLSSHYRFDPAYVDTLLAMNLQPIELEPPTLLRSFYDCKYIHKAIAAHGKCVFSAQDSGSKELFIVAETGGLINLTVRDIRNNQTVKDGTPKGKPSAQAHWEMERLGEYEIEVENTTDKDISIIIVAN